MRIFRLCYKGKMLCVKTTTTDKKFFIIFFAKHLSSTKPLSK